MGGRTGIRDFHLRGVFDAVSLCFTRVFPMFLVQSALSLCAQSAGVSVRTSAPGVWSMAVAAEVPGSGGSFSPWRTQFTLNGEGLASADLGVSLRREEERWASLGLGWDRGRTGTLVLTAGEGPWVAGIRIPMVQPHAQPFRPLWWCAWKGGGGRVSAGAARLDWNPGALPSIRCSVRSNGWEIGGGSRGMWLSHQMGKGRVHWHGVLGISRGNIPWAGIDAGPVMQCTSRDLHARWEGLY